MTDPRFLAATLPEIAHDYWLHTLTNRLKTAMENDVPVDSLDDLIAGVTPQERADAIDKEIEAKYAAANSEEKETVIEFRGKK